MLDIAAMLWAIPLVLVLFFAPLIVGRLFEWLNSTSYRMTVEEHRRWVLRGELPSRWPYNVRHWYQRVFGIKR